MALAGIAAPLLIGNAVAADAYAATQLPILVTLPDPDGDTKVGIAFSNGNYLVATGGGPSSPIIEISPSGTVLQSASPTPGIDFRSLSSDPQGNIYAKGYSSDVIYQQAGFANFTPIATLATMPGSQSQTVLDASRNNYIANDETGLVQVYNLDGSTFRTIQLAGYVNGQNDTPIASAAGLWYTLGAGGDSLQVYDPNTGKMLGSVALEGTHSGYGFGIANGYVFVQDGSSSNFLGYAGVLPTIDTSRASFNQTDLAVASNLAIFAGGTLKPTTATTFNQQFYIVLAGSRVDNSDGNLVFTNTIDGTTGLTFLGGNKTTLAATNIYTGATSIASGTLEVDGALTASNVVVNSGGTLSGIGTVFGASIAPGGQLSPGNASSPTGTLTFNAPLTFSPGSFYNVAITPTRNSRIDVAGPTTIQGGTVNVRAEAGPYSAHRYTIVTATSVTGRFAAVSTDLAFIVPTLAYDGTHVYLDVAAPSDYRIAAATQNQLSVATGLTKSLAAAGANGRNVLTAFNQLTAAQARVGFDSITGEGITAAQNLAYRSAQLFNAAIFDQATFYGSGATGNSLTLTAPQAGYLALAPQGETPHSPIHELADVPRRVEGPPMPALAPVRTWRAWGSGFGGVEDVHGDGGFGTATQNNQIYGGAIGIDYQLTPDALVGVAVGGSEGEFSVPGRSTYGSTTGGHIAVYDIATFGDFYGASSSSFSYFSNRTTRNVAAFGGLGSEMERGDFDSHEFRTRLEFGRHFSDFGGTITPFVALEVAELRSNGFTESAISGPGLFALDVNGQSSASVPSFLGMRYQTAMTLGSGLTVSPSVEVAYVHEFAPQRTQFGTLNSLPGATFLVDGARPSYNAAKVKTGGELALSAKSFLFANFDGEFSDASQYYGGRGGFKYLW